MSSTGTLILAEICIGAEVCRSQPITANVFAANSMEITSSPITPTANISVCDRGQKSTCLGFTMADIQQAVIKLNFGHGSDEINVKCLKYIDSVNILNFAFFIHSNIPQGMLNSVTPPRVKNKYDNSEDSKNLMEVIVSLNLL